MLNCFEWLRLVFGPQWSVLEDPPGADDQALWLLGVWLSVRLTLSAAQVSSAASLLDAPSIDESGCWSLRYSPVSVPPSLKSPAPAGCSYTTSAISSS